MGSSGHSWRFRPTTSLASSNTLTVRDYLMSIMAKLDAKDPRPPVPLGHGDPSTFPCFRTTPVAEEAIVEAVRSGKFNCYCTSVGLPAARDTVENMNRRPSFLTSLSLFLTADFLAAPSIFWALAEYLNQDLSYKLSPNDVFLTSGCIQAIEVMMSILASPGANILLPRPGFPFYEARCAISGIEARHFDLLPDRNWEVDLDSVEALTDEKTAAIVVINPGNPCGNVFTYDHMAKIAETAKRLGILVISDEVYSHLAFGSNPFVSMGVFADIVPVIMLGSISKRWVVPGWRLGWIAANDPKGILKETKIIETITRYLSTSSDPPTFIQGAFPDILRKTKQDFFDNIICILKQTADICYSMLQEIGCIHCPHKPEGSMFVMVKLELSLLDGISDDLDFCLKLSEEESVIILPGTAVGCKNWLRITFAIDPSSLEDGLTRLKSFCKRHEKQIK